MAELSVALQPLHAVTIDEVEIEYGPVGGSRDRAVHNRSINFTVCCETCGWRSPTRFRARKAAEVTGREHGDDAHDIGQLWLTISIAPMAQVRDP